MATYYLDIETTGVKEKEHQIITIQYVELERGTGKQIGDLTIFKAWELGEEGMIKKFMKDTPIMSETKFDFIPVGYNLIFEHKFLEYKSRNMSIPINILFRPIIDLYNIGILMNRGEFKGSGLDRLTGKQHSGMPIIHWHDVKKYDEIEDYVKNEAKEFIKWYVWLLEEMPKVREQWKKTLN